MNGLFEREHILLGLPSQTAYASIKIWFANFEDYRLTAVVTASTTRRDPARAASASGFW
jgi:hypothetical protein